MMNREQAIAYGKRTGCRYFVKNSNGGLLGGFTTREAAESCRIRWEKEYQTDPWNRGMKVFVVEEVKA